MRIKQRLTLWYFVFTFGILLLFSFGTYFILKGLLYRTIDKDLEMVLNAVEKSYDPDTGTFTAIVPNENEPGLFNAYYLIVYNKNSIPVFKSPTVDKIGFPGNYLKETGTKGFTSDSKRITGTNSKLPGKSPVYRLINRYLYYRDLRVGRAVIGMPVETIKQSLNRLLDTLIIANILAAFIIMAAGYFFTRKALQPIENITLRARHLSSSNLNERIDVNNEDEIGDLSKVLNDLFERLEKAFSSQQEFMADAAHELKTPLSILRARWENELNNPELSLEFKERAVHDIETISRLTHLINNLLLLTKTETLNGGFVFEVVHLKVIIKEVIADLMLLAESKSQVIEVEDLLDADISGDRMRLYQLFFNLLDNAIRYSPSNGKICIAMRIDSKNISRNFVVIEIKDTGPGIPEEEIPNIFKRFYRIQKDRARKTGGSGLGLSICKLITEMHNGELEVESKVGEGSTFRVKLPIIPR